jgi:activator of HSP90 ATPase
MTLEEEGVEYCSALSIDQILIAEDILKKLRQVFLEETESLPMAETCSLDVATPSMESSNPIAVG